MSTNSVRAHIRQRVHRWRNNLCCHPICAPCILIFLIVDILLLLLVVAQRLVELVKLLVRYLWPWSSYNKNLRTEKREANEYQQLVHQASDNTISINSPPKQNQDLTGENNNTFFHRIPSEIRQQIMILAFGEQTIHMDLQFRFPFDVNDKEDMCGRGPHAMTYNRHVGSVEEKNHARRREGKIQKWRWYSCVCHRFSSNAGQTQLALGRKSNHPWNYSCDPSGDTCLDGVANCCNWPEEWPGMCQIGIMGWLLSCKQAYVEGIDVLYRTNTIHISSPVLMRSIQDVFSRQRLENIACLELVWQPKMLPLKLGFTDSNTQWHHTSPTFYERHESNILAGVVFPCLRILRISFATLIYNKKDYALGIEWPYRNKKSLSHRLRNHFLPTIDRLLERAVPPTTDVTVSCSKWDWYQEIDHVLMETQGVEETRMQHAGIKEFRCWRNTPQEVDNVSDRALEDAIGAEERRKGFWIQACIEEEDYESQLNYGLNRRDVYNLGPKL